MQTAEQIQVFNFGNNVVRAQIDADGNSWWVAKDVCSCLDLGDVSKAVERLAEDEKGTNTVRTLGGEQVMLTISEAGIYRLIFTSRKAEAEIFKRWIFHEVLPSIRKTGSYSINKPPSLESRVPVSLTLGGVTVRLVAFPDQQFMWLNFKDFSVVLGVPNMDIGSLRSTLGTQHRYTTDGDALEPLWAAKLLTHSRTPTATVIRKALGIDACPKRGRFDLAVEKMLFRNPNATSPLTPSYEQPPAPPRQLSAHPAASSDGQLTAFGELLAALHAANIGVITMTKLKAFALDQPESEVMRHCKTLGFLDGDGWRNKRASSTLGAYQGRNFGGYALRPIIPYSKWTVEVISSPAGQL